MRLVCVTRELPSLEVLDASRLGLPLIPTLTPTPALTLTLTLNQPKSKPYQMLDACMLPLASAHSRTDAAAVATKA